MEWLGDYTAAHLQDYFLFYVKRGGSERGGQFGGSIIECNRHCSVLPMYLTEENFGIGIEGRSQKLELVSV